MRSGWTVLAVCAVLSMTAGATTSSADAVATTDPDEELAEVLVVAPEPRYVAPTTRDRIGRVWVPVHVDGKGPFRLVLDTGAQRSAVVPRVAEALGIPLDRSPPVRLHGVTGTAITPTIDVDLLQVGDLWMHSRRLPVLPDAFGGAEGLLGMDGMEDRRIYIDFRADFVDISLSRNQRPGRDFFVVPVLRDAPQLLMVRAQVAGVDVRAIIDTGAQATVGNEALRRALRHTVRRTTIGEDQVHGATGDVQSGIGALIPDVRMGPLVVRGVHVTFSDLHIFSLWELTDTPSLLVGMDILGLVDTLIIDYHRREVHIRPRGGR